MGLEVPSLGKIAAPQAQPMQLWSKPWGGPSGRRSEWSLLGLLDLRLDILVRLDAAKEINCIGSPLAFYFLQLLNGFDTCFFGLPAKAKRPALDFWICRSSLQ